MSNVINFLERMGQDSRLRYGSSSELQVALANERMAPELRLAILADDRAALDAILGAGVLCCMQYPVREDEEESEESPAKEEEIVMDSIQRCVAATG